MDTDEFHLAGGMLQRPLELVKCKTIPLDVPADAEIVLECETRPGERLAEAPFGEYPGTYGPRRMNPVLEIKALTRRGGEYRLTDTVSLAFDVSGQYKLGVPVCGGIESIASSQSTQC